jgi:hypothetical protein
MVRDLVPKRYGSDVPQNDANAGPTLAHTYEGKVDQPTHAMLLHRTDDIPHALNHG